MNFKQLETFLHVAELGNLSKAAVNLGLTQPILSKHIRSLEQHLGADLFHRTGRGLKLTDAGSRFYVRANQVVEEMRQAELDIRGLKLKQPVQATIAFPTIMAGMLVDPLVREMRARHAHIQLRLREGTGGPILNWVVNRQVDAAILYDTTPLQHDALQLLYQEKLYLIGQPGLRALGPTTDVGELVDVPLILPGPKESLRTLMEMAAMQRGIKLKIVAEGDSYNTVRLLIEGGHGFGVLPRFALLPALRTGALQASLLVNPEVTRKVVLTTCSNRVTAVDLKELTGVIKNVVQSTIMRANEAGALEAASQSGNG